jgi:hypothetical protein
MKTVIDNMDLSGLFMEERVANETSFAGCTFVQCFVWLAHSAFCDGRLLYRLRPKLHLFDHEMKRIARWRFNSKAVSCFSDEDFIGRICAIAQSCSHQGIVHGCLRKYLSAMYSTLKLTL